MPTLTAEENILLPILIDEQNTDAYQDHLTTLLELVGLAKRRKHKPDQMSGGEQQRVALARAFVMRPTLLMADEPTGSLDFATGESVMQLMFALNAEVGTTLLLVTHDHGIAKRCQQTLTLAAGQVVLPG